MLTFENVDFRAFAVEVEAVELNRIAVEIHDFVFIKQIEKIVKTVDVKVGPETRKFKLNVLERTVKVHGDEFALRPAYPELKEGTPAGYINARKDEVPAPAKKN